MKLSLHRQLARLRHRACHAALGIAAATLLGSAPLTFAATDLPAPVVQALKTAGIPLLQVGAFVQGVDSPTPLVHHNAQKAMNPASAMKLVTTYAALELLGPAHTWKTEALAATPPSDGILAGHLYLRGSGDPALQQEQLWLLLRKLRSRGVREIAGDIVLDRSAFDLPPHDPGAFDNDPLRPYNTGADALLINLASVQLTLRPDTARQHAEVVTETAGEAAPINNRLTLTQDACGDWRERIKVRVDGATIELAGQYATSCGEKNFYLSPWPADEQAGRLLRGLWQEMGGTLRGQVRSGVAPGGAISLAGFDSAPLGETVRDINKFSNNVMARQVFLSLDRARPATYEGARRRIDRWLEQKGLRLPELVLDNGSGLSRKERISAEGLGRLLLAAWKSPAMPELMASLPVAGIDGTLKRRFPDGPVNGRAHLKTGYLDGARALAGYVLDQSGRRWVVVVVINDAKAQQGRAAMDELLRWVAAR